MAQADLSQIRIVGYRLVDPSDLLAHPANPRRHPAAQRDALRASLRSLGWVAPILVNVQTQHVLDGHARVEEALSADVPQVPVLDVDLPPADEPLFLATFDPITAMAALDREALDGLLREIDTGEAALQQLLADVAQEAGLEYSGAATSDPLPFDEFSPVAPADTFVAFRFGDYSGRVAREVYDTFVAQYQAHQADDGAVMLDDVLRGWLHV